MLDSSAFVADGSASRLLVDGKLEAGVSTNEDLDRALTALEAPASFEE